MLIKLTFKHKKGFIMNNATKKVLPVIILATVFSTASAVATESKSNTLLANSGQCAAGEIVINSNQIIYATNTDSLIKHEVNTETLFTSIENQITADFESSINKMNAKIDSNLSKITSSLTTYISTIVINQ